MSTRLFRFSHPRYRSDQEDEARNSAWVSCDLHLPPITCDVCGTWGSSEKLRIPVPPELVAELIMLPRVMKPISFEEWQRKKLVWARMLDVPPEQLWPSAELGFPTGTVRGPINEDVVHAAPGYIWVQDRVKDAVVAAGFTGVRPVEVVLDKTDVPRLWELHVSGAAFRLGTTLESLLLCTICRREGFPNPKNLTVDVERWDGSDFFNLDRNPNMTFVTERVRDLFVRAGFSNCEFVPI